MQGMLRILLYAGWCAAAAAAEPPPAPAAQAPPGMDWLGGAFRAIQSDDLQVGAIFDFASDYTRRRNGSSTHEAQLREVELGFGARLSPYLRFDTFLGIAREEGEEEGKPPRGLLRRRWDLCHGYSVGPEEAYLTLTGLPGGLTARAGKMKAAVGWANTQHAHALPWPAQPLVVRNLLGEEAMVGEGIELSWLAPWDQPYTEVTFQCMRCDEAELFSGDRWSDRTRVVHVKNVFDLTPSSTFEAGLSAARGPDSRDPRGRHACLGGIDLTYKWRPVERALYRSFTWRTEFLCSRNHNEDGERQHVWGAYTAPEYQFARRWAVGARFDYAQLPDNHRLHERGCSLYVTFTPNHYCFWRAGVERTARNFEDEGSKGDTMLFLQLNFGFGAHRAHKY